MVHVQLAGAPCCSFVELDVFSPPAELGEDWEALLDRLAAAICQAGIEADFPNCGNGFVDVAPLLGLGAAWAPPAGVDWGSCSVGGAGEDAVDDSSAGRDALGNGDDPSALPGPGELGPPLPPSRLPSNTLRLFNSVPSSLSRFSLPSLAPSRAFGMESFSDLTSSLIRRVSSSFRRDEVFRSATTVSTSLKAASKRSVRASSADFKEAVSVESCSINVNARENCSSIFSLSCSNCGGVGGAIKGVMYRFQHCQQ